MLVVPTRFVPHIYVCNHHLLKVLHLFSQTVSTIYSLFLAMTLFPDVQKKAQDEIDAVVGPDRLPSFADRNSLPYTEALVKEVLRWNVVVPTGARISLITLFIFQRQRVFQ
jgi:cytochrome P450